MQRREFVCGMYAAALALRRWRKVALFSNQFGLAVSSSSPKQLPSPVAGIRIVDSHTARTATELSRSVSPPYLFHHAVRTFLFASLVGHARNQKFDEEVLYLACILHDLGLTDRFEGNLPFEIQGAQAARHFLEEQGYDTIKTGMVWDGIAMHPLLIGQYKQPEVALVGVGAGADVLGPDPSELKKSDIQAVVDAYPRLAFKTAFVKTCAEVVRKHPEAAAHTFMRDIGERYVPQYPRRNICDLITQAPFAE
jgi:hypothetical protein